jgi:predicted transcriptional regulator
MEGIGLKSEKDRWEMKLERLQERTNKVLEELAKSSLSGEDKAELYESFLSFMGGMCARSETSCLVRFQTLCWKKMTV